MVAAPIIDFKDLGSHSSHQIVDTWIHDIGEVQGSLEEEKILVPSSVVKDKCDFFWLSLRGSFG